MADQSAAGPAEFCGALATAYLCEGAWDAPAVEKVRVCSTCPHS